MRTVMNKRVLVITLACVCIFIAIIYSSNNSKNEEVTNSKGNEEIHTTAGDLEKTTSAEVTEESTTEDIPYVGMDESEISSTSLGEAHYYGANHIKTNNGWEKSDIYDFYNEEGYTIFVINVVKGKVYKTHDHRGKPWDRRKNKEESEKPTDETTTILRMDPYGAEDYHVDDYEDFYYDNYDDFEHIDDAADYLEEYWDEDIVADF